MTKNTEIFIKLAEVAQFGPDLREKKNFPAMDATWYLLPISRRAKYRKIRRFHRGGRARLKIPQNFLTYPKIQYLAIFNLLKKIFIKISYKKMKNLFTRFLIFQKNVKMTKNTEIFTKLAEMAQFGPDLREKKNFLAMDASC